MRYVNIIGLDLGQSNDPTALVFLECPVWVSSAAADEFNVGPAGWRSPSELNPHQLRRLPPAAPPELPPLLLRGLKRYELGTRYPIIVADVARLIAAQKHREQTVLVVDKTGVGAPVYDLFIAAALDPIGVSITGGDQVHSDGTLYRVPKRDLVGAVQSLLQTRRLKFAEQLPLLPVLMAELKNFRVKIDPATAHDSYSAWREHEHDDMVLAAALACWWAESQQDARGFSLQYDARTRMHRGRFR
ncbi:MAG TPA: hypothetical protein VGJ87_14935 [Roseiflexaceae bacterium]|jgi:hypothetical protein